ncbi:MAG: GGDEF domain-containing protein [Candidatus Sedimenticola sp. 6PFRAG7]
MSDKYFLILQLPVYAVILYVLIRHSFLLCRNLDTDLHNILIKKMYESSHVSMIAGPSASIIIIIGLWNHVDRDLLVFWFISIILIYSARGILVYAWAHHPKLLKDKKWGEVFVVNTFLTGSIFSSMLLFNDISLQEETRILIVFFIMSIPISSIPGNSSYLPAYYSLSTPIILSLFYWSINQPGEYSIVKSLLLSAYFFILLSLAHIINSNYRKAVSIELTSKEMVDELSKSNHQLKKMASIDPLSGLSNRQSFHSNIERICKNAIDLNYMVALIRIDYDDFIFVNKILGHQGGDYVLKQIAIRLNRSIGTNDYNSLRSEPEISRYGGDEFLVLLSGTFQYQELTDICKRTTHNLTQPIVFNENTIIPSLSMGAALIRAGNPCIDDLLDKSDEALSEVKLNGKNNFIIREASING